MRPNKQIGPTVPQSVGGPVPAFTENGGRRRGKHLKVKPRMSKQPFVTVGQAKAALAIDPNAVWDVDRKCLIYNRKVGE
jgi:hypothetical protein